MAQSRLIARLCAFFKAYTGGRVWKTIGNRHLKACYLSRDDHDQKIRTRKQRTDVGIYFFVSKKAKGVPLQAWSGPEGSRKLRFPDFMTTAQDGGKVVSLRHRSPLPPGNTLGTHFC